MFVLLLLFEKHALEFIIFLMEFGFKNRELQKKKKMIWDLQSTKALISAQM